MFKYLLTLNLFIYNKQLNVIKVLYGKILDLIVGIWYFILGFKYIYLLSKNIYNLFLFFVLTIHLKLLNIDIYINNYLKLIGFGTY